MKLPQLGEPGQGSEVRDGRIIKKENLQIDQVCERAEVRCLAAGKDEEFETGQPGERRDIRDRVAGKGVSAGDISQ